jgi:hypothetical protein
MSEQSTVARVLNKTRHVVEFAPVILSAVPAGWVAVTWDAEPSLAFPVLVSGFPLIIRSRLLSIVFRWVAVILLAVFAGLGMFSVGRLFVPAIFAMVLSALWATVADLNGALS